LRQRRQRSATSVVPPGLNNQAKQEPVTVVTGISLPSLPGLNRSQHGSLSLPAV